MRFTFDNNRGQTALALIMVLALAAQLRLMGITWDDYAGLHADERHMFLLAQAMLGALSDPANSGLSLSDWWFSESSPLNPHLGDTFYVYGEAPLLAGVLVGQMLGITDGFAFMALARCLSVAMDTLSVLMVFIGARFVGGNAAGLFAATLYAAMPSALQLANFYTVDVWMTTACALSTVPLMALASGRTGGVGPLAMAALAGVGGGLALAVKITGAVLALPGAVALLLAYRGGLSIHKTLAAGAVMLTLAMICFRLINPFAFEGPGVWGLWPSRDWLGDFSSLMAMATASDFPPGWQWSAGYGPMSFLRDFALFGSGPVAVGLLLMLMARPTLCSPAAAIPLTAFAAFFLIPVTVNNGSLLRYVAPALAPMAMLLAMAPPRLGLYASYMALAGALWWGGGVVRLHDGQHPRVVASHWLWALPRGTVLTNETIWDEPLPAIIAPAPGEPYRWPSHDDWFVLQTLGITDPDGPEKAQRMAELLARTDFLILSSERQFAVMPRLPERFPMTAAHYRALFSGEACFSLVLAIDRGYPLPGLPFRDAWSQEPWRIYDHPQVRIFRRDSCYDPLVYAEFLKSALAGD
ncbi:glycosyltransferase family 39 protein [Parahaliea mediterranea]|uniref:glycosyltransferase family 39 protein n=1 Tax=Parahaliea mediterranea TaxID=651086 RepID=UPI000E2E56D7|nr:glycosyltransferase family 39 protein [Parahaliea mediterranea]